MAASVLLVLATVVGSWLVSGVGVGTIALFLGYEVAYGGIPGLLLQRALSPGHQGTLRRVALGWPLGYALEIAAYALTSALHVRGALPYYPLTAVLFALVAFRRRRSEREVAPSGVAMSRGQVIACAAVAAAAALLVAGSAFPRLPLPGSVAQVTYPDDPVWHVSVAAEAANHWLLRDPNVSGEALPYHIFLYLHAGAVHRVTGIDVTVLIWRLLPLALVALLSLQLTQLARSFSRRAWAAPLAPFFFFFVGELDLDPWHSFPFQGQLWNDLWVSPTFLFGLVFFVPALVVLRDLAWGRAGWIALALLLLTAEGAKSATVPVIAGGLLLLLVWQRLAHRPIGRGLAGALAVAVAVSILYYAIVWHAAGSSAFSLDPPGAIRQMPVWATLAPHSGRALFWIAATAFGLVGRYGGLLPAAVWFGGPGRRELDDGRRLLICLFAAGLVPFLLLEHPGYSQLYFADYGAAAACVLAADGIVALAASWGAARAWRLLTGLGVLWLIALLVLALQGSIGFAKPYTALARAFGVHRIAWSWVLYPLVAWLVLLAIVLVLRRGGSAYATPLGFALVAAVVVVALLDQPLDVLPQDVHRLRHDQPLYDTTGRGLSLELYRGLFWLRENAPTNAVVAVDNQDVVPSDGAYFGYAAFSERRIFLGGWVFSNRASELGYAITTPKPVFPFPTRLTLQRAVFERADRNALSTMVRDYHVRYLLLDRANGHASPRVAMLGRRVFSNSAVSIYAVG